MSVGGAVLLDFGGVIWNMRWDVCRALEQEHGLPQGTIFLTLYGSDMWREVECGRADREHRGHCAGERKIFPT